MCLKRNKKRNVSELKIIPEDLIYMYIILLLHRNYVIFFSFVVTSLIISTDAILLLSWLLSFLFLKRFKVQRQILNRTHAVMPNRLVSNSMLPVLCVSFFLFVCLLSKILWSSKRKWEKKTPTYSQHFHMVFNVKIQLHTQFCFKEILHGLHEGILTCVLYWNYF